MVVDSDENWLTGKNQPIEALWKQLSSLWPPRALTGSEKGQVIEAVTSILGHHLDYAASLSSLASVYRDVGDHASALPIGREAVEIHQGRP